MCIHAGQCMCKVVGWWEWVNQWDNSITLRNFTIWAWNISLINYTHLNHAYQYVIGFLLNPVYELLIGAFKGVFLITEEKRSSMRSSIPTLREIDLAIMGRRRVQVIETQVPVERRDAGPDQRRSQVITPSRVQYSAVWLGTFPMLWSCFTE